MGQAEFGLNVCTTTERHQDRCRRYHHSKLSRWSKKKQKTRWGTARRITEFVAFSFAKTYAADEVPGAMACRRDQTAYNTESIRCRHSITLMSWFVNRSVQSSEQHHNLTKSDKHSNIALLRPLHQSAAAAQGSLMARSPQGARGSQGGTVSQTPSYSQWLSCRIVRGEFNAMHNAYASVISANRHRTARDTRLFAPR